MNSYEMKKSKYMWCDKEFDDYCKEQAKKLREFGFNINTSGITRMLCNKVIKPNNLDMTNLIKDKIKVRKCRRKQIF